MTKEKNLRALGDRIEDLIQEIGQIADPNVRDQAEELVRSVMDLYGAALARICEIAGERSSDDDGLIHRLAEDDLIASLLILHGLHPLAVETRIERALDRVRPYLGSHGGDVKLLGVRQGIASLRLEGSCHGCPSSTLTMKLAIEKAIQEAAPELTRIKVTDELQSDAGTTFDGTEAAHMGTRSDSGAWIEIADLPKLADDHVMGRRVAGIDVILCRLGETFFAYQDSCPSCHAALRIGGLQQGILTCSACGRGFDVRRAGQAVDASGLHMEPLPLLGREGGLRVAIPGLHT